MTKKIWSVLVVQPVDQKLNQVIKNILFCSFSTEVIKNKIFSVVWYKTLITIIQSSQGFGIHNKYYT